MDEKQKPFPWRGDKLQRFVTSDELSRIHQQKLIILKRAVAREEFRERLDKRLEH